MPFRRLATALTFAVLIAPLSQASADEPPKGFTALFDGKTLDGWQGRERDLDPRKVTNMSPEERTKNIAAWTEDAKKHWSAKDGVLVNDGHGMYLTTDKEYGDMEFLIDYKTVPLADSGIYLRGTPQVQIWDSTENSPSKDIGARFGSGGLWNNSPGKPGKDPLVKADKPFGEWNHFRIIQVGARTTVYLNEQLVVDNAIMENYFDRSQPLPPKGPIQLQTHGGVIEWKNIFIREIPATEANEILSKRAAKGFTSLFDGKTLEGWAGAAANYEVVNGAIRCKPDAGGVVYFDKEYSDFVARVEFKLPPGGNNGLAIRYPGSGDTAYQGMCELQVLDDSADKYAKLDPRQYHGSVYGIVASKRGYQRPVGEWNFEEVTVKGSHITVELNGSIIVDADISKITEYMANSPHPGKDRTSGFFGFAGHGDPVEFRNISIRPL
jgi:hypothetical protein